MQHPLIGLSRHRIGIDGAGVTTLVTYHGCPLRCKYCLNPQALTPDGVWKTLSSTQILKELRKDDLYFQATDGGVTFGGGEPMLRQREILRLKSMFPPQWKINMETSLNVDPNLLHPLIPIVDHWIVDIKDMNPAIYKMYTGSDNSQVIANLKTLIARHASITSRVPLIPQYNSEPDIANSIATLREMGINDFDQFTYTTKINRH